jgi:hypothetical protein
MNQVFTGLGMLLVLVKLGFDRVCVLNVCPSAAEAVIGLEALSLPRPRSKSFPLPRTHFIRLSCLPITLVRRT